MLNDWFHSITYSSAVGARDVGADLFHGLVEVVLPHHVALCRQFGTRAAVDVVRVVAVVAAAVTLPVPRVFDVLLELKKVFFLIFITFD